MLYPVEGSVYCRMYEERMCYGGTVYCRMYEKGLWYEEGLCYGESVYCRMYEESLCCVTSCALYAVLVGTV